MKRSQKGIKGPSLNMAHGACPRCVTAGRHLVGKGNTALQGASQGACLVALDGSSATGRQLWRTPPSGLLLVATGVDCGLHGARTGERPWPAVLLLPTAQLGPRSFLETRDLPKVPPPMMELGVCRPLQASRGLCTRPLRPSAGRGRGRRLPLPLSVRPGGAPSPPTSPHVPTSAPQPRDGKPTGDPY